MASKKNLRGQIDYLRKLYFDLSDLHEADMQASGAREATAVEKLAALTDQAARFDKVVRERDKALRELQAARVAAEALRQALYPGQYAKGGLIGPAVDGKAYTWNGVVPGEGYVGRGQARVNVGDLSGLSPAANETYRSIMGLKNKPQDDGID